MGKGFKHGSGGGGPGLDFSVVGSAAEPMEPEENMIWVNTDRQITAYRFSPAEPEEPMEGMVWILTGNFSTAAFDALKKGGVILCPLIARQYLDGAWVKRTAKSYQGGAWVSWGWCLFDNGDECADLTDGWTASGFTFGTTTKVAAVNSGTLLRMAYSGSGVVAVVCGTAKKVDLSLWSNLRIRYRCANHVGSGAVMNVGIVRGTDVQVANRAANMTLNDKTGEDVDAYLDISDISGEFYIVASVWGSSSANFTLYAITEVELL